MLGHPWTRALKLLTYTIASSRAGLSIRVELFWSSFRKCLWSRDMSTVGSWSTSSLTRRITTTGAFRLAIRFEPMVFHWNSDLNLGPQWIVIKFNKLCHESSILNLVNWLTQIAVEWASLALRHRVKSWKKYVNTYWNRFQMVWHMTLAWRQPGASFKIIFGLGW